jgi:hypothetical protein
MRTINHYGLLLEVDDRLPSVTSLVAGEPVRGSWWSHPAGRAIFAASRALLAHPDIVRVKLVARKLTYVHRRLWSPLVAVATGREAWQLQELSQPARQVLRLADRLGELRTDQMPSRTLAMPEASRAAHDLEERLLIRADEIHTEHGAHAQRLRTWGRWAEAAGFIPEAMNVDQAKAAFEQIAEEFGREFAKAVRLPWPRDARRAVTADEPRRSRRVRRASSS